MQLWSVVLEIHEELGLKKGGGQIRGSRVTASGNRRAAKPILESAPVSFPT
jgi:hypothetical protein